jgi:hypothetical protein
MKLVAVQGQLDTLLAQMHVAAIPVMLQVEIHDRAAGDDVRLVHLTERMSAVADSIELQLNQAQMHPFHEDCKLICNLEVVSESVKSAVLEEQRAAADMATANSFSSHVTSEREILPPLSPSTPLEVLLSASFCVKSNLSIITSVGLWAHQFLIRRSQGYSLNLKA